MRVCGATVSGVSGALAVGMSINGCVFFICTLDLAGGSGGTVVRAVSFFGLLVSAGGAMGKGIAAAAVDPIVAASGRAAGGSVLARSASDSLRAKQAAAWIGYCASCHALPAALQPAWPSAAVGG